MIGLAIVLCIIVILTYIFLFLKNRHLYWEKRGVPYLKPRSILFGNSGDFILGRQSGAQHTLNIYNDLAPHGFGGVFQMRKPVLYVRDPELIKNILIKDFNYFPDRDSEEASTNMEPLMRNLFNLTGEQWKLLRQRLSPTFTSGRMKLMFDLVLECTENVKTIMDEKASLKKTVNIKDLTSSYTMDVISSSAFGLQANTLHEPNSKFLLMGQKAFDRGLKVVIARLLLTTLPTLARFLGLKFMSSDFTRFFTNVVRDTIEYRKKNNVQRNDFLNLLISIWDKEKVEKTQNLDFDVSLLTAQCVAFFLAGFESSSNTISFLLFELARHQDIQKKLQDEVDSIIESHNGQITYDAIQEMHYMDKVIDETLRHYPALCVLTRFCIQDYPIPRSDYVIRRGEQIFIPIYGLHHDPKYFKNPFSFDPEQFSQEEKLSRPNQCFLPFGDGPRYCIGMKFGMMQVKAFLAMIMKNYSVTVAPEMKLPIEFKRNTLITGLKNDILLNITER